MDASHSYDALIGLFAPSYKMLKLVIAPRIINTLDKYDIQYKYNKADNIITTKSDRVGDFLLMSLEVPDSIVAFECYRSHVDEIDTLNPDHAQEAWEKVIARTRQTPKGADNPINRASIYTTPEGFGFTHKYWVKNKNKDYQMIKASSRTNPYLPSDYVDSLIASYPAELVSAYVDGEFVNMKSGTVYKSYNRVSHDSREYIKPNEPLFIGCDFNVTKQAATVYVRRQGGREWHAVSEFTDMYDTPDMIRIFKERYPGHRIVIYPDASGGARKSVNANISDIALLNQAGFEVRNNPSNPTVKDRVNAMNAAFSKGIIFVNTKECPTVANCLEQQAYDKNGEPNKKSGVDHQNDASSYPIAYEMPINRPIAHIPVIF